MASKQKRRFETLVSVFKIYWALIFSTTVVLAVDTSGSRTYYPPLAQAALAQLQQWMKWLRRIRGRTFVVLFFDDRVVVKRYTHEQQATKLYGGGGTDYSQLDASLLREHLVSYPLVVFTDGEAEGSLPVHAILRLDPTVRV